MRSLRLVFASVLLMSALACGDSSPPAAPTPPPPPPAPPPAESSSTVTIPVNASVLGDRAYTPGNLTVAAGTRVTWMNVDAVAHTSTSNAAGWNSGTIAPGAQFSFTFQTVGSFPYHCAIHPGMVGTVVVQ